jgi:hypothetical protein
MDSENGMPKANRQIVTPLALDCSLGGKLAAHPREFISH